jgi:hypothetical protein
MQQTSECVGKLNVADINLDRYSTIFRQRLRQSVANLRTAYDRLTLTRPDQTTQIVC